MSPRFGKYVTAATALAASLSLAAVPSSGQEIRAFVATDVLFARCAPGPANDPSFCNAFLMGVADTLGPVYLRNCVTLVLETMVSELLAYVAAFGMTADMMEDTPAVNVVREMIRTRLC